MSLYYVTGNLGKFEEAAYILSPFPLKPFNIELVEIQGDPKSIILHKAKQALSIVKAPLIVDDVSLTCKALGGLPGPYIKDFLIKLGDRGFAELVHKFKDHSASVTCHLAYIAPEKDPILVEGSVEGKIVLPRGSFKLGSLSWNPIVQPNGFSKTFAEMDLEEHSKFSMRSVALNKLKTFLNL